MVNLLVFAGSDTVAEEQVEDDDVAEEEVEDDDVAEEEVEDDDVEEEDVEKDDDDDVEDDDGGGGPIPRPRQPFSSSLRSGNALGHVSRAILCENLQVKCRRPRRIPRPRPTLCASLRSRNTRGHFTRATLYGNLQENAGAHSEPRTRTHILCEPAGANGTWTFHKSHFIRKFIGKVPQPRWSTLIKHRPLHLPQEPLSVDTLFWEKTYYEDCNEHHNS